jgi:hypothetical protein
MLMNIAKDQLKINVSATLARNARALRKFSIIRKNLKVARAMLIARWGGVPKSNRRPKFWDRVNRSLIRLAEQKDVLKKFYIGEDNPLLPAAMTMRELPPFPREGDKGVVPVVYADKFTLPAYCTVIDVKGTVHKKVHATVIGAPPPYALELRDAKTGEVFTSKQNPDGVKIELLRASLEKLAGMSPKEIRVEYLGEPQYIPPPKQPRPTLHLPAQGKIDFTAREAATVVTQPCEILVLTPPASPPPAVAPAPQSRPRQVRRYTLSGNSNQIALI